MTWILLVVAALHLIGIGWGLPGSDGWDNDGVAPRDFLPGLAATYTPSNFYTYPPIHLLILALLTLPVVLVGVMRAPSWGLQDAIGELLHVPYMTTIACVARLVSLVMSLGIVIFLARIAEEMRAHELGLTDDRSHDESHPSWLDGVYRDPRVRRVGWCTAVFAGLNATLTYYAQTTNLDVPYLFWATGALLLFTRAMTRRSPRLFRYALAVAVVAVGTKDQAYAMFLLSLPTALLLWSSLDSWAREHRSAVMKEVAIAAVGAVVLFVVVDAVVINPMGFRARVAFLTGSASRDFVEYTRNWVGRVQLLRDAWRFFDVQYPKVAAPLIALGIVLAVANAIRAPRDRRGTQLVLALLPLLVAVSFTATFNWASLRSNARFLLPQALMLALYGGYAIALLVFALSRVLRAVSSVAIAFPLGLALIACVSVDVNMLFDPRYEAESWLREHVQPGETIETYGLNVYQPRFPAGARVIRVGPEPIGKRNPLPGVTEVEAPFEQAPSRDARWIVFSTGWGWRYLIRPDLALPTGRQLSPTQYRTASDEPATTWFDRLVMSKDAFQFAHESKYELEHWFPIVDVHGTTGRRIWIYVRKSGTGTHG